MCTASGPKLVLTQFIFTLISILLIRINSHYVTFSSLPFKNECSVNDSAIIHHFYCNYRHDYVPPFLRLQCSFSDSNVAMFHHFSDSSVSPTPMLFLRLQHFSDSNVAMFHHFSVMTSFLKNSKYLLVIFYMFVYHH
jgi:hypothetical protein